MAKIKRTKRQGGGPWGEDWLMYRPYESFSTYDAYYLKRAKDVYKYLVDPSRDFRDIFDRDILKEISVLVTSYFEDYVNELGLWQTLTRKNKELYGVYIPFYGEEDYDPEYINSQDFAYLLWHFLGKLMNKTLDPFAHSILEAAVDFVDYFEDYIEDAPILGFYEDWLDIPSDIYFFELKLRQKWITFDNYLFGPEFSRKLSDSLYSIVESESHDLRNINPESLIYSIQEDFQLIERESWCGLKMTDWLAEVVRCPEELKTDIQNLSNKVTGMFLFKGHDEKNYHFEFIASGRFFAVTKESIDLDTSRLEPGKNIALFSLLPWKGEWWLSGGYTEWPIRENRVEERIEEIKMDAENRSFFGLSVEDQEKVKELEREMEEAFLEYFGDRLVIFPDQKSLKKGIEDHHEWWNHQKANKGKKSKAAEKYEKYHKDKGDAFDGVEIGTGSLAAFYVKGEGVVISPALPRVIQLLKEDSLDQPDSVNLFYMFFMELGPQMIEYFMENVPLDLLRHPFESGNELAKNNLGAFLRYYNAVSLSEKIPSVMAIG